jgi:hypothetical protein
MTDIKFLGIIILPVVKTEQSLNQKLSIAAKEQLNLELDTQKHLCVYLPMKLLGSAHYAVFETDLALNR